MSYKMPNSLPAGVGGSSLTDRPDGGHGRIGAAVGSAYDYDWNSCVRILTKFSASVVHAKWCHTWNNNFQQTSALESRPDRLTGDAVHCWQLYCLEWHSILHIVWNHMNVWRTDEETRWLYWLYRLVHLYDVAFGD